MNQQVIGPETQFATFDLGTKRVSGILESASNKTIRVKVVDYIRNPITNKLHVKQDGKTIKRHIDKHRVKILQPGIVPSGRLL